MHIFLTGPTASGKTAVGIELARLIGAEIISMDSMAIYRGMEIGTAAPTAEERALVPHHLVGFLDPRTEYSVADYLRDAERVASTLADSGQRTLFVGGTPLYLKTMLRGLFEGPPTDAAFREEMQRQMEHHGPDWLHERLREVDPLSAARLHRNDTRRVIRALEVFRATGIPISTLQQQFDRPVPQEKCRVFVLDWSREMLYDRINRRVDHMFRAGLTDEAYSLWNQLRGHPKATAAQAVGYRELFDFFEEKGKDGRPCDMDRPQIVSYVADSVRTHTRQFAKRQGTWFRSLSECRFIPLNASTNVRDIARHLLEMLEKE